MAKHNFIILQKGPNFPSDEPPEFHGVKSFRAKQGLSPQKRTVHGKTKVFQAVRWLRTGDKFIPARAAREMKQAGHGKETIAEGLRRKFLKEGVKEWAEKRVNQELWRIKTKDPNKVKVPKAPKASLPKTPKPIQESEPAPLNRIQQLFANLNNDVVREYAKKYYEYYKRRVANIMPQAPLELAGEPGHLLRVQIRDLINTRKDLLVGATPSVAPVAPIDKTKFDEEVKRISGLKVNEIVNLRSDKAETIPGINESFVLYFEDGTKAIFKPRSGDVHQEGLGADHEVATYRLSEILGLHVVPPTGLMTLPGTYRNKEGRTRKFGEGNFQKWMPGLPACQVNYAESTAEKNDPQGYIGMRILDALIANTDRHTKNWIYDEDRKNTWAIDNGGCLTSWNSDQISLWDVGERSEFSWLVDTVQKYRWGASATHNLIRDEMAKLKIDSGSVNKVIVKMAHIAEKVEEANKQNRPITVKTIRR